MLTTRIRSCCPLRSSKGLDDFQISVIPGAYRISTSNLHISIEPVEFGVFNLFIITQHHALHHTSCINNKYATNYTKAKRNGPENLLLGFDLKSSQRFPLSSKAPNICTHADVNSLSRLLFVVLNPSHQASCTGSNHDKRHCKTLQKSDRTWPSCWRACSSLLRLSISSFLNTPKERNRSSLKRSSTLAV